MNSVCCSRKMGESLMEDICKPLRNMCDNHAKVKKPVSRLDSIHTVKSDITFAVKLRRKVISR